jgi:CRISPR-associated endonuclease/helicase Cas3
VEPEPALFLHGPQSGPADVLVAWRADLNSQDSEEWPNIASRIPVRAEEAIALPVWAVRRWLAGDQTTPGELVDLEGAGEAEVSRGSVKFVLRWRGRDDVERITGDDVRPGMTILAPSNYGGCDEWGWNPESSKEVEDIGDAAAQARGAPALRLQLLQHRDLSPYRLAQIAHARVVIQEADHNNDQRADRCDHRENELELLLRRHDSHPY